MRTWFLIGGMLAASSSQAAVTVNGVSLCQDAKGWRVVVRTSGKTTYRLHALHAPERVLIDIPDATLQLDPQVKPASAAAAPVVRYSQFTRSPNAVRVVVHLPEPTPKWFPESAVPARNIALRFPEAPPAANPVSVARRPEKPEPRPAPAQPKVVRGKKATPPAVISARELERQMREAGTLPRGRRSGRALPPPLPPVAPKPRVSRVQPASASTPTRSTISSRGGLTDRTPVLASLTGGLDLPPAEMESVEPSWTTDEALALIESGDAPAALKRRLKDVVSDPAVRASRYVWGAETPGQFDCSGLMLYIYDGLDVRLPRTSLRQCEAGVSVGREALKTGDLVFFITRGKVVSHVGVYLGDGKFLHAANPRSHLQITSLDEPYYARRFSGARRIFDLDAVAKDTTRYGG